MGIFQNQKTTKFTTRNISEPSWKEKNKCILRKSICILNHVITRINGHIVILGENIYMYITICRHNGSFVNWKITVNGFEKIKQNKKANLFYSPFKRDCFRVISIRLTSSRVFTQYIGEFSNSTLVSATYISIYTWNYIILSSNSNLKICLAIRSIKFFLAKL